METTKQNLDYAARDVLTRWEDPQRRSWCEASLSVLEKGFRERGLNQVNDVVLLRNLLIDKWNNKRGTKKEIAAAARDILRTVEGLSL